MFRRDPPQRAGITGLCFELLTRTLRQHLMETDQLFPYSLPLPEDLAMSDAVIYRVFKLPTSLLAAIRDKRDQVETTNVRFLADAVDSHLPSLVKELQRLGFGLHGGDQQVARLPFSGATLSLLRTAAEVVDLPTTKLLELCLVAALHPHTRPKRRRRRSKSVKTVETKPGRTKRRQ